MNKGGLYRHKYQCEVLQVKGLQSNMEDENGWNSNVRLNSDDHLAEFVTNTIQPEETSQKEKESILESLEEFADSFANTDVDIIDKGEDIIVDNFLFIYL